jgi:hypothetical protein
VKSLISGVPGFVSYAAFRTADLGTTVTICQDKAGTDESSQRAAGWVKDNISVAVTPVITEGDSYDNALAETINGLYKAELIFNRGPWRTVHDDELATLSWVHWFNTARLLEPFGNVPPAEFDANYNHHNHPSIGASTL